MPNILLIETTQATCSVALAADDRIVAEYTNDTPMQHATSLPVYIENTLAQAQRHNIPLEAIAVSGGPGSYTGLRIGISTAKGLAYALRIPLIAVDTLLIMATQIKQQADTTPDTIISPMIDARRMEVYTALYDHNTTLIHPPHPKIITPDSYSDIPPHKTIIFGGNGAGKCRDTISRPNTIWLPDIRPTATAMNTIATHMFTQNQFADIAYYEPFYLKEFQATTPKQTTITQ